MMQPYAYGSHLIDWLLPCAVFAVLGYMHFTANR